VIYDVLPVLGEISRDQIIQIAHFLVALYLSISFHEAAHAWMANRCGDDTARLMGRMTLNPVVHIDPIGTILMPLLMVVSPLLMPGGHVAPLIGWAKPVPVNPLRFRQMRRGEILVSLAGPVSNFILAAASIVTYWLVLALARAFGVLGQGPPIVTMLLRFLESLMALNLILGLFNLIPIPPLDGSHILGVLISRETAAKLERFLVPPLNFIILLFVAIPLVRLLAGPVFLMADFVLHIWW